jgi:hypothetical protein
MVRLKMFSLQKHTSFFNTLLKEHKKKQLMLYKKISFVQIFERH